MLLDLFLRLLEWMGRKKVLVDFAGNVRAYRYYVFFMEEDEDTRLIGRLPNIYIHVNVELNTPDGPDTHRHPWNTYSYMIRGGYLEEVNGKYRFHETGTVARLRHTDYHRVVQVRPGTVTAFMHGWRRGPWLFRLAPCAAVCPSCDEKYGKCYNEVSTVPHATFFGSKGKWRTARWFLSKTPGLRAMIERRRRASADVRVKQLSTEEVRSRMASERG
jgi:hypothetical protein